MSPSHSINKILSSLNLFHVFIMSSSCLYLCHLCISTRHLYTSSLVFAPCSGSRRRPHAVAGRWANEMPPALGWTWRTDAQCVTVCLISPHHLQHSSSALFPYVSICFHERSFQHVFNHLSAASADGFTSGWDSRITPHRQHNSRVLGDTLPRCSKFWQRLRRL